ncbi:queuosine precursor transporter [Paludibacter sp.]|uniref:queuosine precursor transporter n=1 Tax=Paludibacter sp. TaxID=1898105 RepID=UPI0013522B1E|nr:queuosine precursor transporter [Paludibacter sp.]MTK52689.1 queuosine precursor transporter [Paludibacter sp.]
MKQNISPLYLLLTVVFTTCLLISNLVASKIVVIASVALPVGIFLFPITYIINDVIAEVWGFRKARLMIWLAFAMNFFAVLFYQFAVALPPAPFWSGQDAFSTILSQTPRIAVASLLAFLAGSFLNAYVMSKMKVAMNGNKFSVRAIASTMVGESADSAIFIFIAFCGILTTYQLVMMMITQALLKTLYEIIILPITQRVVVYIKKKEQTDVFDTDVSYSIWKVKEV